jgi:hypothetical protein
LGPSFRGHAQETQEVRQTAEPQIARADDIQSFYATDEALDAALIRFSRSERARARAFHRSEPVKLDQKNPSDEWRHPFRAAQTEEREMTQLYAVIYDRPEELGHEYCLEAMDYATAERMLALFKARYLDADGRGKAYPNGKGFYEVSNPRIVECY